MYVLDFNERVQTDQMVAGFLRGNGEQVLASLSGVAIVSADFVSCSSAFCFLAVFDTMSETSGETTSASSGSTTSVKSHEVTCSWSNSGWEYAWLRCDQCSI